MSLGMPKQRNTTSEEAYEGEQRDIDEEDEEDSDTIFLLDEKDSGL